MKVGFTSTYGGCHGHDCMIVGFTSTYVGCHGHDCMIVRFTSTYDGLTAIIGRSKSYFHTIMTMTATIGIEVHPTIIQS
jgi:hypothetical protein